MLMKHPNVSATFNDGMGTAWSVPSPMAYKNKSPRDWKDRPLAALAKGKGELGPGPRGMRRN